MLHDTPLTPHQAELAKFNRPYTYQRFPAMLYKGIKTVDGKHETAQQVVDGERQEQIALENGWCQSPTTALERLEGRETKHAIEAAHRAHDDRRMSAAALAEADAFESHASGGHVAELPEQAKRGPGRPRKPVE